MTFKMVLKDKKGYRRNNDLVVIFMISSIIAFSFYLITSGTVIFSIGETTDYGESHEISPLESRTITDECQVIGSYAYIEFKSRNDLNCEGLEQKGDKWITYCECE